MAVEQLQHLALGDDVGGVGEDLHDPHAAQADHHFEGAGVEEITHQYAGLVAPDGIGGLLAAAQHGGVHHVVVEQGGGVDELDDGGQVDMLLALVVAGPGRQQHQKRAQALAAAVDNVLAQLIDQHHLGAQLLVDIMVHGPGIRCGERADVVEVDCSALIRKRFLHSWHGHGVRNPGWWPGGPVPSPGRGSWACRQAGKCTPEAGRAPDESGLTAGPGAYRIAGLSGCCNYVLEIQPCMR